MILLELNDDMIRLPKEVFLHLNEIYVRADKGNAIIKEYGHSQTSTNNFLGAFGGGKGVKICGEFLRKLNIHRFSLHKTKLPVSTVTDAS
jgi:hypothetical protein